MGLLQHIWPWSELARQEERALWLMAEWDRALDERSVFLADNKRLRLGLAAAQEQLHAFKRFDHGGDGRPGGSRKRKLPPAPHNPNAPALTDADVGFPECP